MDLIPYLSAVILASTIATIVLALFSYAAFKLRNQRRPTPSDEVPIFFDRVILDDPAASPEEDGL